MTIKGEMPQIFDDFKQNVPQVEHNPQPAKTNNLGAVDRTAQGSANAPDPTGTDHDKNSPPPPEGGFWTAMGASMFASGRPIWDFITGESQFEPDTDFIDNHRRTLAEEWLKTNGEMSDHERSVLFGTVSLDNFNYQTNQLQDRRMRQQAQGTSFAGTLTGSIVDYDLAFNFLPLLGQVKFGTKVAVAGVAGTGVYGLNSMNTQDSRTDLERAFDPFIAGGSALFGTGFRGIRGTRTADELLDVTRLSDDLAESGAEAVVRGTDDVVETTPKGLRALPEQELIKEMEDVASGVPTPTVRTLPEEEVIRNASGEIATPNPLGAVDDTTRAVVDDVVEDTVQTPVASQMMYDPKILDADGIIDIARSTKVSDELARDGHGQVAKLADGTEVRSIVHRNSAQDKHKYFVSVFDHASGELMAKLTYFNKGGARSKHTELAVHPSVKNPEAYEDLMYGLATQNKGKLPNSLVTQGRHMPDASTSARLNEAYSRSQSGSSTLPITAPVGTPAHMNQSISRATQQIVNQQTARVQQGGGQLATVNIMGVNMPVPINLAPYKPYAPKTITSVSPMQSSKASTAPNPSNGTPPPTGNAPTPQTPTPSVPNPPKSISQDVPDRWATPDWYKDTAGKWIESSSDKLSRLTAGITDSALKQKLKSLLANPETQGANATYHAGAIQGELVASLMPFEKHLLDVVRQAHGTTGWKVWERKDHLANLQKVMNEFHSHIQTVDRIIQNRIRAGNPVTDANIERIIATSGADDNTQALIHTYIKSDFATKAYDHMVRTGLITDEMKAVIPRRATYMPIRHSYEKLDGLLRTLGDKDVLYDFIGDQIMNMYPALQGQRFSLTARQLGQNFVRNQEDLATNLAEIASTGISGDALRKILATTNLSKQDIDDVIDNLVPNMNQQGSNAYSHLRQRIDWRFDIKSRVDPVTGRQISMADIIDNDVVLNLNDYARTTAKRVGLAHYGVMSPSELDDLMKEVVRNRPANVAMADADNFVRNVKDSLLGLPTGEPLAPTIRTLNTLGSSMVLSGSGIWQIMDLATQTMKLGVLRSIPHISKGLRHATHALRGTSRADANKLYDIITQRLSSEGRWRGMSMRYEDNFSVHSGMHETVAFMGQSTRFFNLSESIKRFQVGLMGGIFVSAFEGAAKGSAKDIKFLKEKLKMSDELVNDITTQYQKSGGAIDNWDSGVRVAMEQKVFFEADNMAYTIRTGELPPLLEHSSVGKALFPFMSFTMSMQNKLLDHTYTRDGIVGLAQLAALQLPLATLLGMVNNVKNGKDPEEDLASSASSAISMLGIWNIPLGAFMNDGFRGGGTIFTPFNKAYLATQALTSDEASGIDKVDTVHEATPFLGAMTGLHLLLSMVDDD